MDEKNFAEHNHGIDEMRKQSIVTSVNLNNNIDAK